jgi:hypothetical protein
MKTMFVVLLEAFCIGVIIAVMTYLSMLFIPKKMIWIVIVAFICGASFHILCQITGLNDWYVKNYYK